jgi:4-azaleucine resistance transporter AzlC
MLPFVRAAKATVPFMLAHFPLAVTFGLLFQKAGYCWFLAPIASFCIYGGAVQFVGLNLVNSGASLLAVTLTALPVASCNSFYGLSLLNRFRSSRLRRAYLAFGLVDSTYAILTTQGELEKKEDDHFVLWVIVLNHVNWVSGTVLGALLGVMFAVSLPGAQFVVTTLFVVLLVEQYHKIGTITPFVIAGLALLIGLVIAPTHLLLIGVVAGSLILMIREALASATV